MRLLGVHHQVQDFCIIPPDRAPSRIDKIQRLQFCIWSCVTDPNHGSPHTFSDGFRERNGRFIFFQTVLAATSSLSLSLSLLLLRLILLLILQFFDRLGIRLLLRLLLAFCTLHPATYTLRVTFALHARWRCHRTMTLARSLHLRCLFLLFSCSLVLLFSRSSHHLSSCLSLLLLPVLLLVFLLVIFYRTVLSAILSSTSLRLNNLPFSRRTAPPNTSHNLGHRPRSSTSLSRKCAAQRSGTALDEDPPHQSCSRTTPKMSLQDLFSQLARPFAC